MIKFVFRLFHPMSKQAKVSSRFGRFLGSKRVQPRSLQRCTDRTFGNNQFLCLKPGFTPHISFGINCQGSRCVTPSLSLIWCAVKYFKVFTCRERCHERAKWLHRTWNINKGVFYFVSVFREAGKGDVSSRTSISVLKIICHAEVKWCSAAAEQNKIPLWASQ